MAIDPNDPMGLPADARHFAPRREAVRHCPARERLLERAENAHRAVEAIATAYARVIEDYEVATLAQSDVLLDACRKSQALKTAVDTYSVVLRTLAVPPDVSLALVRSATKALGGLRRYDRRMMFEDVARWFAEAYHRA